MVICHHKYPWGAVAYASTAYQRDNLKFIEGACSKIPLADQSIDVVASFETIEHITEHDEFLSEVRRVLRPDGLLIISTPDRDVYAKPEEPNPFHLRELTKSEFYQLLWRYFPSLEVGSQKTMAGSIILPDQPQQGSSVQVFHRVNFYLFEEREVLRASAAYCEGGRAGPAPFDCGE